MDLDPLLILTIIVLIGLSGMFSGLTLGLLSLSKSALERKIKLGDKRAEKIYSVRQNGNLLLTTLLLGNVAVNTALSLFLGSIASGIVAGITATFLILIFGEIVPQAVFARHALRFGSTFVLPVKIIMAILYPIAGPISHALNRIMGEEIPTIWSKKEVKEMIKTLEDSPLSDIDQDEERAIIGALTYSEKTAEEVMSPRPVCLLLEENTPLNESLYESIKEKGFTRIPVYQKDINNIIGVLNVKDLIGVTPHDTISAFCRTNKIIQIHKDTKLDDLLNKFIKQKIHIAAVFDDYQTFLGIVTLEDVTEEVIGLEIVDEKDLYEDLQSRAKKIVEKMKKRENESVASEESMRV